MEKTIEKRLEQAKIQKLREFTVYEDGINIDSPCTHFVDNEYNVWYVYSKPFRTGISIEKLLQNIESGKWTIENKNGHYAYWNPDLRGRPN
jgi:hypothetical protein